jgi:hypothetical protein
MSQLSMQPLTHAPKDTLSVALDRLGAAIDKPVPGQERNWAIGAGAALASVESALRLYRASAKDPNGSFSEIDITRPSLAREADDLRLQQELCLTEILALRQEVQAAAQAFQPMPERSSSPAVKTVCDFGDLRQKAEQILTTLEDVKGAEAKLVLESVCTDIGGGD